MSLSDELWSINDQKEYRVSTYHWAIFVTPSSSSSMSLISDMQVSLPQCLPPPHTHHHHTHT